MFGAFRHSAASFRFRLNLAMMVEACRWMQENDSGIRYTQISTQAAFKQSEARWWPGVDGGRKAQGGAGIPACPAYQVDWSAASVTHGLHTSNVNWNVGTGRH